MHDAIGHLFDFLYGNRYWITPLEAFVLGFLNIENSDGRSIRVIKIVTLNEETRNKLYIIFFISMIVAIFPMLLGCLIASAILQIVYLFVIISFVC